MLLRGTLLKHLAEIDKTCYEMLNRLIPKVAEREGVNEELKAACKETLAEPERTIYSGSVFNHFQRGGIL